METIYRVQDVVLTLSGTGGTIKPPVSAVIIDLRENGIPEITCVVDPDPSHTGTEAGIPAAIAPTLTSIKAYSDRLQRLTVDSNARGALSFKVTDAAATTVQNVTIKDWIVTGAGIRDANATGGFALAVTLQHPIGITDRSTANIGNVSDSDTRYPATVVGTDIVTAYAGLLKAWLNKARTPEFSGSASPDGSYGCGPAAAEVEMATVRQRLITTVDAMVASLAYVGDWPANSPNYTKWPMNGTGGCMAGALDKQVWALYGSLPPCGMASPWEVLDSIRTNYALTIIPTYWDTKLQLTPFTPWSNPSMTIWDDEIAAISLPPADPAPVAGARVSYTRPGEATNMSCFVDQGDFATEVTDSVLWVPEGVRTGKTGLGRVIESGVPDYINGFFGTAATVDNLMPADDTSGFPSTGTAMMGQEGASNNAVATDVANGNMQLAAALKRGAAATFAKQLFLTYFKSGLELNFNTYLCVQKPDSEWYIHYVIPGCCARIKSRKTGTVIFDFYVKRIVHTIDVAAREAVTRWFGSYARPEGGYPGMAVNDTYNPLYTP